ncbi:MAG: hypothetical protein AAF846_00620 [Chloroflexota bacterium]
MADYGNATRWWWDLQMKWEKFKENAYRGQHPSLLRGWGRYCCRTLNDDRIEGTRLATLTITMVVRDLHAPNEPMNPLRQEIIWNHWCYAEYAPN